MAVQDGDERLQRTGAKAGLEPFDRLRCERDFRHQYDGALALLERVGDGLQIDLRLAAAGDAVEEERAAGVPPAGSAARGGSRRLMERNAGFRALHCRQDAGSTFPRQNEAACAQPESVVLQRAAGILPAEVRTSCWRFLPAGCRQHAFCRRDAGSTLVQRCFDFLQCHGLFRVQRQRLGGQDMLARVRVALGDSRPNADQPPVFKLPRGFGGGPGQFQQLAQRHLAPFLDDVPDFLLAARQFGQFAVQGQRADDQSFPPARFLLAHGFRQHALQGDSTAQQ